MTTILRNTGISMDDALSMPHPQFYALASRLHREENAATARQMDATKTAIEVFWHGKQEILDGFFKRYQAGEKQAAQAPASDRLAATETKPERQKSNMSGFKALAKFSKAPKQV